MKFIAVCLALTICWAAGAASLDWSDAIRGPFPILSVPYEENGDVDLDVLVKEARFVADVGVNGFIWAQSNDAIDLLTIDERKTSFETLARAFAAADEMWSKYLLLVNREFSEEEIAEIEHRYARLAACAGNVKQER